MARRAHEAVWRNSSLFAGVFETGKTLGRASPTASDIRRALQQRSILAGYMAAELVEMLLAAAANALSRLKGLRFIEEVNSKQRGRFYACMLCLDILSEGTESLEARGSNITHSFVSRFFCWRNGENIGGRIFHLSTDKRPQTWYRVCKIWNYIASATSGFGSLIGTRHFCKAVRN